MNLNEVNKPTVKRTVVIYGGRFQPFHKGHNDAYQRLCSKFGSSNVYIGTSNDTSGETSPFSFNEKKEIATTMFGIPSSHFIKVNNPYRPNEILKKFDGKTTQYIAAVGDKDADRLQGKYFKPYKGKDGYGYDEIGYTYPIPPEKNPISGTQVRRGLGSSDNEKAKKFFLKAYPKYNRSIFTMIKKKLAEGVEMFEEDGMPGGIGTGLVLPGGYINGAPTGSQHEDYNSIQQLVYDTISESELNKFLNNYFSILEGTDDAWIDGFATTGKEHNDTWEDFDNPKQGYTDMLPGWNVQGHLSDSLPKSVKDRTLPKNNHFEENGEMKRVMHPSKGETYAAEKKERWEMNPMTTSEKVYAPDDSYKPVNIQETSNPIMDRDITYTNSKGQKKKIIARNALRLPKDHPAHIQAARMIGPDDAPVNQPKKKEQPGVVAPAKQPQAPQPGQPVPKAQTVQAKADAAPKPGGSLPATGGETPEAPNPQKLSGAELKSTAEKNLEKEKQTTDKEVADDAELKKLMPGIDTSKKTLDQVTPIERQKVATKIDDLVKMTQDAKDKGEKPKYYNLCQVSVPGTNLYCDGNLGIDRNDMPQFKGKARTGSPADKLPKDPKSGEVDTEQFFKEMLEKKGIKVAEPQAVPADRLKATQMNLVGDKVAGMEQGLEQNPQDPNLTAPIYVSNDGYVLDGHHRWAAIVGYNAKHADKQIPMNVRVIDQPIKPLVKMSNDFADHMGIEKKAAVAGQGAPKLNENISESKENTIQNFVEFATKRLKLKETPKVILINGPEYANQKSSLGGYSTETQEVYAVSHNRLTADICRTIAHELVHRKQDEVGLLRSVESDGADGSPIENQAHAVAGILMREYGRKNKKIFQENINIDVDKGDTVLMGKFKNKKVVVKDIGKDDHGMPTINGKKAATFRLGDKGQNIFKKDENIDEMKSTDVHFLNIIKLYRNSTFKKRINAYLFGKPNHNNANAVAKALRNMGYDEITQMEKELNIKPNFDEQMAELYEDIEKYLAEISGNTTEDGEADGGYVPKGKKRVLDGKDGVNKSEDWFTNGGYIQTDFPVADAIFGDDEGEQRTIRHSIKNLRDVEYVETEFIKEGLLIEGGAYGHMAHPFDDMDLTFGDLKNIISSALNGELGVVREKTDGQALAISWKKGRLIAARNKGNLANAGANAMGIDDVSSKFQGRGGLSDAYNYAMQDLNAAISGLSDAQKKKIFREGECFMNLEVIWPASVNVIPYGQALLVFHNTVCYDKSGNAIGADSGAASTLAGMIKQINAHVQTKYTIQGPPIISLPKSEDLSSKQGGYLGKLSKLQSQFHLKDDDNVANYHQVWWENFIDKNAPIKVDKLTSNALVKRWAFGDKSFRLQTISNAKLQTWAIQNDKVNVPAQQKANIKPFEEIFLGVGADVLSFVSSVLTVHPDKAIRSMKDRLKSIAAQVRSGGDPSKVAKLKQELSRLSGLGGINNIVAAEGLVFFYGGKTYKLTGTFAPLNQILGIFYS